MKQSFNKYTRCQRHHMYIENGVKVESSTPAGVACN